MMPSPNRLIEEFTKKKNKVQKTIDLLVSRTPADPFFLSQHVFKSDVKIVTKTTMKISIKLLRANVPDPVDTTIAIV